MSKPSIDPAETAKILARIDQVTSDTAAAVERVLQAAAPAYTCMNTSCECESSSILSTRLTLERLIAARRPDWVAHHLGSSS